MKIYSVLLALMLGKPPVIGGLRYYKGSVIKNFDVIWNRTLLWRHNGRDGVSNHQPHDCLLNRLFRRRSKQTSKLRVTGLCAGNSPGTGEFPAEMASNAENVSIWWRHHVLYWAASYIKAIVLCIPTQNLQYHRQTVDLFHCIGSVADITYAI